MDAERARTLARVLARIDEEDIGLMLYCQRLDRAEANGDISLNERVRLESQARYAREVNVRDLMAELPHPMRSES